MIGIHRGLVFHGVGSVEAVIHLLGAGGLRSSGIREFFSAALAFDLRNVQLFRGALSLHGKPPGNQRVLPAVTSS